MSHPRDRDANLTASKYDPERIQLGPRIVVEINWGGGRPTPGEIADAAERLRKMAGGDHGQA